VEEPWNAINDITLSASILGNLGIDKLIAESEENYIRAAVRLAKDA